ncbi:hypothetical protein ASAP_1623 [Asaia bogorensis]|uniref:Uncharacterized protein n=1 Tax=Asaia bogorensis TaxID=91915 RepID=A0A060QG70_9PROT|nr:hypothetical protein P792_00160 [Asaia sp. SF2.1]CDG39668.1 hypothetical protein ASAP_1623 [Asaia bogorensis]
MSEIIWIDFANFEDVIGTDDDARVLPLAAAEIDDRNDKTGTVSSPFPDCLLSVNQTAMSHVRDEGES